MRRSESREYNGLKGLSSSTSSIRSSNYSVPRNYTPSSLSSYRYSASVYTPPARNQKTNGTSESPSYSSATLGRVGSVSSAGSALTRSSSSSYARALYQSPANTRSSLASSYASATNGGPASFSSTANQSSRSASSSVSNGHTSRYSSLAAPPPYSATPYVPPTQNPPAAPRSRSSSAISSYRSINVAALNQQARERADRDEKDKNYSDWLERERMREVDTPTMIMAEPLVKDFRKKTGSASSSTSSPGYSSFSRSVASRSEISPCDPPRYSVTPTPQKSPSTVRFAEDRLTPTVANGFTGLRNIGNTCFMNATLQMLVNVIELKTYFLDKHHTIDVNPSNPLGFKGRLADAFAEFMRQMWSGQHRAVEPVKIKELVAEKASQFANFAQHDAHEFLSFLLDGLHEDVNRVRTKPCTNTVEGDGRPDIDVSSEAWRNHTLRNDSIFVDLFHGQLKSRLQCPNCDRVSITFDPFVYLAVPFPKIKKSTVVYYWPLEASAKPVKIQLNYPPDGTVQDLLTVLSDLVRIPSKTIRLCEMFSHRIQKVFKPEDKTSDICSGDIIYAFQVLDASAFEEPLVELYVIQRQLYSSTLRYSCNDCGRSDARLKACEACYNAYYCNKDCQLSHWNNGGHKDECKRRHQADPVGQPFVVSVPASQLTHAYLMKVLDQKCRYSVDVERLSSLSDEKETTPTRSSSESSTKGDKKSPSSSRAGSTPRRTTKTVDRQFLLRKLSDQAQVIGDAISGSKGEPLNIPSGSYISINWYNMRYGRPHIIVSNRRNLDIDTERSEQLCRITGKSTSSASSGGDPSLMEMMGMFSETERLKPEESWYCSQCKDHVEATKKLEIYRLPPVLIVQLKRFVYTATYQTMHRRSKDERRVTYPEQGLDIAPYLAETAPHQNTMYDLCGVVCHSGSSYFGHYVSMGRLADFDSTKTQVDWRLFDDSIVSPSSSAHSDDAYLLFYKQRGKTTKGIFRKHYSCDPTASPEPEYRTNGDMENGNVPTMETE